MGPHFPAKMGACPHDRFATDVYVRCRYAAEVHAGVGAGGMFLI